MNIKSSHPSHATSEPADRTPASPRCFRPVHVQFTVLRGGFALALAVCSLNLRAATAVWDGGGSDGGWNTAGNWNNDALPTFTNTLDVVFCAPGTVNLNTFVAGGSTANSLTMGRMVRSMVFDTNVTADVTVNTTQVSQSSPRPLQFDTDATGPNAFAELIVMSGVTGNITLGHTTRSSVVLNDNLRITHNGSGLLTIRRPVVPPITGTGDFYGITKEGTGPLVFTEANTYVNPTIINAGVVSIGAGGAAGSLASTSIVNNAALIFNRVNDLTNSAVISGTGTLTKQGSGTLTLLGANPYSGATRIEDGKLMGVAGGSCGNSDVTLNAESFASALGVLATDVTNQWTCKSLAVVGPMATLEFDFGATTSPGTNAPMRVIGNVNLAALSTMVVRGQSFQSGPGNYALMTWGGSFSGDLPANVTVPVNVTMANPALSVSGKTLYLNVLAVANNAQPLTWAAGDGTWDLAASTSWKDANGATVAFQDGDNVVFDDTSGGVGPFSVYLSSVVNPKSVTVSNTMKSYLFVASGGKITGPTALVKDGAATLTLEAANDYTGPTTVKGGTLALNSVNAIQNASITVESGATLREYSVAGSLVGDAVDVTVNTGGTYDLEKNETIGSLAGGGQVAATMTGAGALWTLTVGGTKTTTFSGVLADSVTNNLVPDSTSCVLALTKSGTGTLVLGGTNAYTGATTVSAGKLFVNGALGNTAVTVASGAMLGGAGVILGTVTNNGTLSPGNSIGALTLSNALTMTPSSSTLIELAASNRLHDSVAGLASVEFGGTLTVTNVGGALVGGESFSIFSAGSYSGNFTQTNLPALGSGLSWVWNPITGSLSVSGGVSQTPPSISFAASGGQLNLSWPASHLGWYAQSNSVGVADPNAWFDIAGSQTATNLAIMIGPAQTQVLYRLRLP